MPVQRCNCCGDEVPDDDQYEWMCECGVISYCSEDCQTDDWLDHRELCWKVKLGRLTVEHANRNWHLCAENDLDDDGWIEKMDAIYSFVSTLLETDLLLSRSILAVEEVLEHGMDAMDMFTTTSELPELLDMPEDPSYDIWCAIPHLQLRLEKNQQCYDFIEWGARYLSDHKQGSFFTSVYLYKTVDMLSPDTMEIVKKTPDIPLSHKVALALLKTNLVLAVKPCLASTGAFRECVKLPAELCDIIEDNVLQSVLGKLSPSRHRRAGIVQLLDSQIVTLFHMVPPAFWRGLLHFNGFLPEHHENSFGDFMMDEEWLKYSIDAWRDSPGAFKYMEDLYLKREKEGKIKKISNSHCDHPDTDMEEMDDDVDSEMGWETDSDMDGAIYTGPIFPSESESEAT